MSKNTSTQYYMDNLEAPPIRILQYNYYCGITSWDYTQKASPFWYLWHNNRASAYIIFNGRKIDLTPDKIYLIPPNTEFSTNGGFRPFDQLYIHFAIGTFLHHQMRREPIIFSAEALFGHDPETVFRELKAARDDRFILAARLYDIVYRSILLLPESCFIRPEESLLNPKISAVLQKMSSSLEKPPGNQELADSIKMSVNNFMRLFKQEIGTSPQHYLLTQRIDQSKNLLLNSTLSIDEIAEMSGFKNRYHFSKTFKKTVQSSPAEFRKSPLSRLKR